MGRRPPFHKTRPSILIKTLAADCPSGADTRTAETLSQVLGLDRLSKIEPLAKGATEAAYTFHLLVTFDALDGNTETHRASEGDHGLDNGNVPRVLSQVSDELTIDLERINGKLLQVGERGLAVAKIIDGQADAQGLELIQDD